MKVKFNNKGAALVEYAVLLSFISAIALSFGSSNGLMGSISGAVNKATSAINMILGVNVFSEAALKDALVGMKDSEYRSVQYNHNDKDGQHMSLGSLFPKDRYFMENEAAWQKALAKSQKFEDEVLSKINFGDVPLESWRFINEGELRQNREYAYLIWSDTDWGNAGENNKTTCMYARINIADNSVSYGVGSKVNPLDLDDGDGRIHGGGGMVNYGKVSNGTIGIDEVWNGDNKIAYLSSDSPYFTSDYNTAVNLYKELQAKSQSK